MAQRGHLILLH